MIKKISAATLIVLAGVTLIGGCMILPDLDSRQSSSALSDAEAASTTLHRQLSPAIAEHPGKSGIYPLARGLEAFAVRVHLAESAERTLDVQYYIWREDLTGTLLFDALVRAADRGVRVRLLLDDNTTSGLDSMLAVLDSHPNLEVRLMNPFVLRSPRWINFLVDFARLNRRMHNKSFTADSQITIIGGRNIGDEYFDAADEGELFADLDVVAIGPVVRDVADDFDRYWNSASSYPIDLLVSSASKLDHEAFAKAVAETQDDPRTEKYLSAGRDSALASRLRDETSHYEWSKTTMLSDDPRKLLRDVPESELVATDLERIFGQPDRHLELVSSYFVPTRVGVGRLVDIANSGVTVQILTNSLDATDVAPVHAGYAKRRKPLLRAGITLYEMRRISSDGRKIRGPGVFGSSGSSLHSKTLSIDGERIFVGSFNFDPRSARLNTELGFVMESPKLALEVERAFRRRVPELSYEVHLDDDGSLYWTERRDGKVIRYDSEPQASLWRRFLVGFFSMLPIEWML